MRRREQAAADPGDGAIALTIAVALILLAWALGEILQSL
jgi:hypothetical protein